MNDKVHEIAFATVMASFTLIMLSFFIFLDGMTTRNQKQASQVLQSLREHFVSTPGLLSPRKSAQPLLTDALRMFAADLKIAEPEIAAGSSGNEILFVENDRFFAADDDQLKAEALEALTMFAQRIREKRLSVVVIPCAETAVSKIHPDAVILAGARAASLFRFFVDRGCLSKNVESSAAAELPPVGKDSKRQQCAILFTEAEQQKDSEVTLLRSLQ